MGKSWLDISTPAKRARLSWIGSGIVVVAAGAWAVVTYFWPHDSKGGINCAENASIATQGDVSHVTINAIYYADIGITAMPLAQSIVSIATSLDVSVQQITPWTR
jgi:hypothetical protein